MTGRLLCSVALVAHVFVLVICTDPVAQASSPTSETSPFDDSTNDISLVKQKKKCHRVKKCPKNEEYSHCSQLVQRAQYCSEKGQPYQYSEQDTTSCKQGCVCKENYLRDDNGNCIPAEKCPTTCGDNEVLANCPADCASDYCPTEETKESTFCEPQEVCPPPACKCAFNHRRAPNGTCIPTRSCPPFDCSARPNEEFDPCPPLCPTDDCSQASPTGECPRLFGQIGIVLICNPKCRCKKGYWRLNGECVPYGQCPGVCPANERYSECIQGECRALNCTQKDQSVPCVRLDPKFCLKGCVCEEGFLRNESGVCVPQDQCKKETEPTTCPPNEQFTECTQIVCRAQKCEQKNWPIPCPGIAAGSCIKGCVCQVGYLRDDNGDCIPEDQCIPNPCQPSEEFSNCTQAVCRAQNCSDKDIPQACPSVADGDCIQGCVCKEGSLRDESGHCVPETYCRLNTCLFNEEWSSCVQSTCRAQNCTQKGMAVECPNFNIGDCTSGCVCKENYLRDESGFCVPEESCDKKEEPPTCPPNEEFSKCFLRICRAQFCQYRGQDIPCPDIPEESCIEGCVCKEGYLRNKNGECIAEKECSADLCNAHEEFSNCTQAVCRAQNCSDKGNPQACPSVADGDCIEGCVCKEGYFRDKNGYCVPEELCNKECGTNQELRCMNSCPPQKTCSTRMFAVTCPPSPYVCKCVCKPGHVKDDNGQCIPEEQCDQLCPQNEEFSECFQATCRHQNCTQKGMPLSCPGKVCKSGCICKENYLRDESGLCVPEEECDEEEGPKTCPPNEEVAECANALCRALNCRERGLLLPCPGVTKCIKECVCKYGYLRDENGVCVPTEQCPIPTCESNEQFSNCTQAICRAEYCTEKNQSIPCPGIPEGSCSEGCVCQEGFLRDENRYCIPEELCDEHCGINQELRCVQPCPPEKTCNNRDLAVSCAPSPCIDQCVCKPGFVKDDLDECIPEEQCDKLCPQNEEWYECVQATCRHQNCTQKGMPLGCPGVVTGDCKSGCICKENYLRDESGFCVPEEECDEEEGPKTCPPNEDLVDCANALCRALNCRERGTLPPCPSVPKCVKDCVCKYGYLRDENGVCVPTEQCPIPTCQSNEEFSNCTQAICRAEYCSEKNQSIPCPGIPEGSCLEGCVCKEGFLRDQNRNCVPVELCDDQCGNNQEVRCVQSCPPERTCNNSDLAVSCAPSPCENKCVCRPGYVKDEINECIPEEECPGPCRENEEFSNCTQAVCRTQNCSDKDIQKACPGVVHGDCIQGCVCQEGYFRDANGYCIPEDLCSKECGTNQELRCVEDCPPEANCGNRGLAVSCAPSPCDYKCVCKAGLIKDYNDECILEEQCDKLCSQNEEWSECVEGTCRHQNCTQKGMPLGCPGLVPGACKPGCICKENYLRDESGLCVPEEECDEEEGPKTCPPNEDLVDCANALCRSLNCNERGILPPCPSVSKCIKDCVCKYGYLRDENGVCVPKEQCPVPICPSNEQFSDCTQVLCRAQFCTEKGGPVFCPSIPEGSCQEGCVCKEGYLRDDDGNCVAENECKAETCPPNEEMSECANAVCRPLNCTHRGLFLPCPQVSGCDKECICKEGFLRDKNGDCVPEDQCPPQITCSENEVLDACPSKCTSDYCPKSPNEKETCLPLFPCTPACRCRFNEKRAENGTCIPTSSCPPFDCSDLPNEEYVACPPYCPTDECGQPRLKGRCPFRIGVVLECFPKCQCKEGYGRVNGTCIPFEECPDLCPANEEYSPCIEKTCRPQNCSERDTKVENCSPCAVTPCHRGCVCKENYFRNEKGVCVPYEECEASLCPNDNEVYTPNFKECPPNTCNSLVAKYKCDSNQKEGPGCVCALGYLRLNTTSPCIPLCDCPEMASSPDCLK